MSEDQQVPPRCAKQQAGVHGHQWVSSSSTVQILLRRRSTHVYNADWTTYLEAYNPVQPMCWYS